MTAPNTITRCSGSWIVDGYRVGQWVVLYERRWWVRAWDWLLRATGWRPHAGQFEVHSVSHTMLELIPETLDPRDVP
jgi:hypothetical protein